MGHVPAPPRRRNHNFSFLAKRRHEIVSHARHVGAAQTDDFDRWLMAWVWHNPGTKDQIWSLIECAKNMGGKITEAKASAITEDASITRKHLTADNLARFLGVTFKQRQDLRLTTIGSVNVKKADRRQIRRVRDKVRKERKRRTNGVRPRAEYLANSTAAKARAEGVSRMTIYRRMHAEQAKNGLHVTGVSAAIFASKKARGRPVVADGDHVGCRHTYFNRPLLGFWTQADKSGARRMTDVEPRPDRGETVTPQRCSSTIRRE